MRRVVPVVADNFHMMPGPCAECCYWETCGFSDEPPCLSSGILGRARKCHDEQRPQQQIKDSWTPTGRILFEDETAIGYAQIGFQNHFPRVWQLASGPASEDCLLLTCLFIVPEARSQGNGKYLLRHLIKEGSRCRVAALEAFAPRTAANHDLLDFYLSQGFQLAKDDPVFPRVRLELKTLVGLQESVSSLLEHLRRPLRKPAAPIPG